jgi:hypothetical protein
MEHQTARAASTHALLSTVGKTPALPWRNSPRVSGCEATHCSSASALHTLFDACAVSEGGVSNG